MIHYARFDKAYYVREGVLYPLDDDEFIFLASQNNCKVKVTSISDDYYINGLLTLVHFRYIFQRCEWWKNLIDIV